jgi:hypothetical protein
MYALIIGGERIASGLDAPVLAGHNRPVLRLTG